MSSPGMGLQHLAMRIMMSLMPSTAIPKSPERACGSSTSGTGCVGSISGGGVASFIVPEACITLLATVLTGRRPEPIATNRSSDLANPISLQICPNTLEARIFWAGRPSRRSTSWSRSRPECSLSSRCSRRKCWRIFWRARDWLDIVNTPRARQKIRQHFRREQREDSEHSGRDLLQEVLRREGLPAQKILASKVFGQICKEIGFAKSDDLFVAIGSGRVPVKTVANKVMQASGTMKEATPPPEMLPTHPVPEVDEPQALSGDFGIAVEGMSDIMIRIAKCCKPIPGDDIVGYISLGKGITIHRGDCKNARALMKNPEPLPVHLGEALGGMAFRVEIMVEALDRNHLLEDLARTLSDSGVNIVGGSVQTLPDGVARDRFTLEVGDVRQLDNILANIRSIHTVYDAYRVVSS